jgi:hypothetical protein
MRAIRARFATEADKKKCLALIKNYENYAMKNVAGDGQKDKKIRRIKKGNFHKVITSQTEEEQKLDTLKRRFDSISNSLKSADGFSLYRDKDCINWINGKAKKGSKALNYYAFDRLDYSEFNIKLDDIAQTEKRMIEQGYNLDGIKSFNRNIWLDLSRQSNAIEGIFEDFSFDLREFRSQIRGTVASDPSTKDFDIDDYARKLLMQYKEVVEKGDSIVVTGKKEHKLSDDTVRHFIAFKYAYKCAKKHRGKDISANDFIAILQNIPALLSGNEFVPYRNFQAYVRLNENSNSMTGWTPVSYKDIIDKIDALAMWASDGKQSGGLHPIEKAAILHAEFIRIHPYADGNGRTARILSNYVLMRNEIPTVALRYFDTNEYFGAIDKAIETHEIDDLVKIFYNAALSSAKKIEECLLYIEKQQKKKSQAESKAEVKKTNIQEDKHIEQPIKPNITKDDGRGGK